MFRKTVRDPKRRNTVSDEIRDEETEGQEEVEGHGLVGEPGVASPGVARSDEGEDDDVEAHGLINQPGINQPGIN
jgi:hypothetical protein